MSRSTDAQPSAGPDFICIGAQKAGTGWLYDQLRNHPDFWMPPMKELHYFDRVAEEGQPEGQRSLPFVRNQIERISIARERARDQRDYDFLDRFERACNRQSLDLEMYADLFEPKGSCLAGDITPGYSTLRTETVQKVASRFSTAKIVFMARDPVERAWSQLSMYVRNKLIAPFDPNDVNELSQHLNRPEILSRSFPSRIVRCWRTYFAADKFGLYFFDNLRGDPIALRSSVISFLGGDPDMQSGPLVPEYNAKAEKQKLPFTLAARSHLAQFFAEELQACATELGGPAADWPKRYSS